MSDMALSTIKKTGIFVNALPDGRSVDENYIAEAKEIATRDDMIVVLEINDVLLKIAPDSDVEKVRETYWSAVGIGSPENH